MHLDEASDVIVPVAGRKIVVRELEGVPVKGSAQVLVSVRNFWLRERTQKPCGS